MLTVDEIKNVTFSKARAGYNPEEVDDFINDVLDLLDEKDNERKTLIKKMDILAKKIEEYRANEDTVKNAFLTTQRTADTMVKEAKEKADIIVKSAENKAKDILAEAEKATERAKDKYQSIHSETAALKDEILSVYKKHLSIVNEMPSHEDVAAKREDLDKKYPNETFKPSTSFDVEDTKVVKETTERKAIADDETANDEKFNQLQFGDNYDVE